MLSTCPRDDKHTRRLGEAIEVTEVGFLLFLLLDFEVLRIFQGF